MTVTPDLLLLLALITFGYVLVCAVWPYRPCRRCGGTGKLHGGFGGIRYCPRCNHTGLRLRLGRHLYNLLRRAEREGNR